MQRVCCLIADGPGQDLFRLEAARRGDVYENDFLLTIASLREIPPGGDLYVLPVSSLDTVPVHAKRIAYGPVAQLPLAAEAGVADFIVEPLSVVELHYRARRLLDKAARQLSWGCVAADGYGASLNGFPLALSGGESRFFKILVDHAGTTVVRTNVLRAMGIKNPHSRLLSIYCSRIRKAIAAYAPVHPRQILKAEYGSGYRLEA